ncbi:MAG TPA: prolyl oligopeptidase family serine peptidase [Puia sp.]|nr:prolyl oligopeptidase family serine peptidase [Puia sp.]
MKHIKSAIFVLIITFFVSVQFAFAQPSRFSMNTYVNEKGDTLKYRQLFPDADTMRKYPLVIFLHGSGERGNDNEAQLKWGVMNFATDQNMMLHPAFVIAPQCPEKMSWSNFSRDKGITDMRLLPTPTKPMELLIELVRKMIKTMPIDSNRIYITGLSMGGFGTYDAIERYPNLFAAAVPVCGGGDVSKAPLIAHLPIWIYHGSEDPAVSPIFSLEMLNALTKAGAHPGFTQYPEVGHFSWLGAYIDAQMMEWLFRQHK